MSHSGAKVFNSSSVGFRNMLYTKRFDHAYSVITRMFIL